MYGIDLNQAVTYKHASMRYFRPHERHIQRYCTDDVLLLIIRGILRFSENGKEYEVRPGEYYIQEHDTMQDGVQESDSPHYLYVHFSAEWKEGTNCLPKRGIYQQQKLVSYMEQLHSAAVGDTCLIERSSLFYQILTLLYRQTICLEPKRILVQKILNDLASSIKAPPSLDSLARQYHYSKNYIIALTKEYCGKTPFQYLGELRLQKALWLLEGSTLGMEEVAAECGFSDYSHFYKAFRQNYNCSPGSWRKRKSVQSYTPDSPIK